MFDLATVSKLAGYVPTFDPRKPCRVSDFPEMRIQLINPDFLGYAYFGVIKQYAPGCKWDVCEEVFKVDDMGQGCLRNNGHYPTYITLENYDPMEGNHE